MESMLTVRLDKAVKEQGTAVMREMGYTPSAAVRRLFDYVIKHDALPFGDEPSLSSAAIRKRIAAFDRCHTKQPITASDEEIREERLAYRYGPDA